MVGNEVYRETGEAAWSWVLDQLREEEGPWLPVSVPAPAQQEGGQPAPAPAPPEDRDSLYVGIAGLAPVLAEIAQYRELDERERALATAIAARLTARSRSSTEPALYDGLAGYAVALRLLATGRESEPLRRLADLATPGGWRSTLAFEKDSDAPLNDVVMGTAGVVMAGVWATGALGRQIATAGGEALLRAADRTAAGLDWPIGPGTRGRMPNYSHGTAGVAAALAVAGQALGREDFVEAAVRGARHLLSLGSSADGGFVVPHTIPPSSRQVEPVTYTWCHGPAGTSHLFTALAHAGVTEVAGHDVGDLRQRCLTSILTSGLPERLRPGFWDNDGRCCGTAGVGDVLLDAAQDCAQPERRRTLAQGARTMGDALVRRAIAGPSGVHWRFLEHRKDPPLLPPGTGWMQGAAGIAAYLLRLGRFVETGYEAPVVDRPDQWWAVPARLRSTAR